MVASGLPYKIFSKIVPLNNTGSWPTNPEMLRNHWVSNVRTSTLSKSTCSPHCWMLWSLSLPNTCQTLTDLSVRYIVELLNQIDNCTFSMATLSNKGTRCTCNTKRNFNNTANSVSWDNIAILTSRDSQAELLKDKSFRSRGICERDVRKVNIALDHWQTNTILWEQVESSG